MKTKLFAFLVVVGLILGGSQVLAQTKSATVTGPTSGQILETCPGCSTD
jgi:hypothetical protein